jgi:hypothetical protein
MLTYSEVDIQVSPSGDLCLAANGDFAMAAPSGVLKQDVAFRVRTDVNDFDPHPSIGSDLNSLIGEPNTKALSLDGENKIVNSLTRDGRIAASDLLVKGVPISQDSIMYYIFIKNGSIALNVTPDFALSLNKGITNY